MCLGAGLSSPFSINSLQELLRVWKSKEEISIRCNRTEIKSIRRRSGNERHRGLEYLWYWTWDIVLNRLLCRYESLSLTHQIRVTHSIEQDDGTQRLNWRIPDLGIVRETEFLHVTREGREMLVQAPYYRLYAIGEIKPAPIDNTEVNIVYSLRGALCDLESQIELFFNAHPKAEAIIGIFIAGTWWGFKLFTQGTVGSNPDTRDDATYVPANEPSSEDSYQSDILMSESCHGSTEESETQSSFDEIDLIGQATDPITDEEEDIDVDSQLTEEQQVGEEFSYYRLGTEESEGAFERLIDALKNLQGCNEFAGTPF